jgi:uncharacterized protein YkwD
MGFGNMRSRSIFSLSLAILLAGMILLFPGNAQAEADCHRSQILSAQHCSGDGLEAEEARLAQQVNQIRAQNQLAKVSLSRSLTLVANRHARDLAENVGYLTHGWSDCLYDPRDNSTWHCIWNAPQRLRTAYPGKGYENAHFSGRGATAASAFEGWKRSSAHLEVILSQGKWKNHQWKALGVGIFKGFAVLWVGAEPDPSGPPP